MVRLLSLTAPVAAKVAGALLCMAALCSTAQAATFAVQAVDLRPWERIFGAVGMAAGKASEAKIIVVNANTPYDVGGLKPGQILIVEGAGPLAKLAGMTLGETLAIRQIRDEHSPQTEIIWERAESAPRATAANGMEVFARERWSGAPVMAGKKQGQAGILWIATSPGQDGTERYPYLLQALADLGLAFPARTMDLWAFFDSSYRIRADVDYLARRWRRSGIGALHIAAWHNMEPDADRDLYLRGLLKACHRNGILTYAWFELPHVSEQFWADHPQWREKTAAGQDAQLDWRKLMNLQNADCRTAVKKEVSSLLERFDWDGVNLAELYFESLEGAANPARFTPMNDDVRREFEKTAGFDPKLLFDPASGSVPEQAAAGDKGALGRFLQFRAGLAERMQTEWMDFAVLERSRKPWLDVVLTHVDDRFEPGMREKLGADIARTLPAARERNVHVLVEDPATLWSLGPERYTRLAEKYTEIVDPLRDLAIDINVVERYQDVYPTKKQTGIELLELVHAAAASFSQVALYFESSIEKQDLSLLPVAASMASVWQSTPDILSGALNVDSPRATRITWTGPVELNGHPWPMQDATSVMVPAGKFRLTTGVLASPLHITDFNGRVQTVHPSGESVEVAYRSGTRAIALVDAPVRLVEVDGAVFWKAGSGESPSYFLLPAGQHVATFRAATFRAATVRERPVGRDRTAAVAP